jgi:hypothetical protein
MGNGRRPPSAGPYHRTNRSCTSQSQVLCAPKAAARELSTVLDRKIKPASSGKSMKQTRYPDLGRYV